MRADGTDLRQVTSGATGCYEPYYSPDGTKIVYEMDANIYVINANGTGQTQLTNDANNGEPQWTPDGSKIVFRSSRSGAWQVHIMDADGSNERQVTHSAGPNWEPTVSIDGKRIAFTSERVNPAHASDIYVINIDGTGETRLTDTSTWNLEPSWPGR